MIPDNKSLNIKSIMNEFDKKRVSEINDFNIFKVNKFNGQFSPS